MQGFIDLELIRQCIVEAAENAGLSDYTVVFEIDKGGMWLGYSAPATSRHDKVTSVTKVPSHEFTDLNYIDAVKDAVRDSITDLMHMQKGCLQ